MIFLRILLNATNADYLRQTSGPGLRLVVVFFTLSLIMMSIGLVRLLNKHYEYSRWIGTAATVVSCDAGKDASDRYTSARIAYHYQVGTNNFENTYEFKPFQNSIDDHTQYRLFVDQHGVNTTVSIRYNSQTPSTSILESEIGGAKVLIPVVIVIGGLMGCAGLIVYNGVRVMRERA